MEKPGGGVQANQGRERPAAPLMDGVKQVNHRSVAANERRDAPQVEQVEGLAAIEALNHAGHRLSEQEKIKAVFAQLRAARSC